MISSPSSTLAPQVVQRLLADWDAIHEELLALIAVHEEREWSSDEDFRAVRLVRHIAVLSTTLHGHHQSAALTETERAWLEAQGVPCASTEA